ncbi:MAG: carbohydrate ABC transporter permease [Bacillota bacterium]|nr:carbohydrate ABC transporter permease [Bacillota bacterium]
MKYKNSLGDHVFNFINISLLLLMTFSFIYPFYYIIIASFSEPLQLFASRGLLFWPVGYSLQGYKLVINNPSVLTGYRNTILYVFFGTIINIVSTAFAAFIVSRSKVKYTKHIMFFIVFTMFFNGGLIPTYLVIVALGMNNSPLALIIPGAISAYNLIILRTAFKAIPPSLEESAMLDGAKPLTILSRILIPVAKPTLAVLTLFYAVGHWNAWFNAMIFLRERKYFPLALILREILILSDTSSIAKLSADVSQMHQEMYKKLIQYCVIVVATLPVIFLYPFLQKYFVKGVMIGSIKE